jgi:hypothetical protein
MPTPAQREAERKWQEQKSLWLARDVYRVERGAWVVGLVLGVPAALVVAIIIGWVVVALTDYVLR